MGENVIRLTAKGVLVAPTMLSFGQISFLFVRSKKNGGSYDFSNISRGPGFHDTFRDL